MDVAISGSHGLVGTALSASLERDGHRVVRLVRGDAPAGDGALRWDPVAGTIDAAGLEGLDAVVHLAGAGIGDKRWTPARKRLLVESRTLGTTLLAGTLATLARKPGVLVSGSAMGYYRDGDEPVTEDSPPGEDFAADLCVQWEAATQAAADAGIRVVRVRSTMILARHGGALARMVTPFRLGLGGRIGSGRQYMSWIALDDEVGAICYAIRTPELSGPVNLGSPNPVTNAEFTKTLGTVLHRPTVLPTPLLPLKAIYGTELVRHLLVEGRRVVPAKLETTGYEFRHRELEGALRAVLGKPAR